jgi:hypothetical protein
MTQQDKPKVIVKSKHLSLIFDYCIESKTAFTVNPRITGDEWEVEFKIADIMGGVALGMFLRENRLEPAGFQMIKPQTAQAASIKARTAKTKKSDMPEISEAPLNAFPLEINDHAPLEEITEVAETAVEAHQEDTKAGGFSPEMLFD